MERKTLEFGERAPRMRFLQASLAGPIAAGLLLFACPASSPADDPVDAYRSFYAAVADGDWGTMFQLLDSQSRACLQKAAERLFEGRLSGEAPLALYLRQLRAEIVAPLKDLQPIERDRERAVLEVRAGLCDKPENCKLGRVTMRREQLGWRVELKFPEPLLQGQGSALCGT